MRFPSRGNLPRLFRRQIPFCARGVGIDGQPNHTFIGVLFLEVLHVAAAVMFLYKRALRIKPFEHDVFALVFRKRMRRPFRVGQRKIWRGASNRRRIRGKDCSSDQ